MTISKKYSDPDNQHEIRRMKRCLDQLYDDITAFDYHCHTAAGEGIFLRRTRQALHDAVESLSPFVIKPGA